MLACHCRAVNDQAVRYAIQAGATDLATLAQLCKAGSGCGGCHPTLAQLLCEEAARRAEDRRSDAA